MASKPKRHKPRKPRDFVTMREITHGTGVGAHRDKKREAKNGKTKHKGRGFDSGPGLLATAYFGFYRDTPVKLHVTLSAAELGVARMICGDCEGSGVFRGHPELDELPCNLCKTSGFILIAV